MILALARNWWSLVLRGVFAIIFAVITFAWPGITLGALVLLFGAYALIDGVLSLIGALRAVRAHERWGALLLEGFAGILAAVVTLMWPAITALTLIYVIAAWCILSGVFEIVAAIKLRKHISRELLLVLMGIASVVFGILIVIVPLAGALVIALWVGAYALVFGILLISLGLRLRSWHKERLTGPSIAAGAH